MTSTSRRKCLVHFGASYQKPPLTMSSLPSWLTSITPQAGYSAAGLMLCGVNATCWAGKKETTKNTKDTKRDRSRRMGGLRAEKKRRPAVYSAAGPEASKEAIKAATGGRGLQNEGGEKRGWPR